MNTDKTDKDNKEIEQINQTDDSTKSSRQAKPQKTKNKQSGLFVSVLALLIALGTCGYFIYDKWFYGQNEKAQLLAQIDELKTDLTAQQVQNQALITKNNQALTQSLEDQLKPIQALETQTQLEIKKTQQASADRKVELDVINQQIAHLTQSLQSVTYTDNQWMVAQANYLVNLASRKIWTDQDYKTAYLLLKNADSTLAQVNDQQLIPARQAIAADLNQISAHSFIDYDGLVLNLMRLSDAVDQLPLIPGYKDMNVNFHDDSFNDKKPVSSSLEDWKDNLEASTDHFLSRFIKVSKINEPTAIDRCLVDAQNNADKIEACQIYKAALPPEQATYLRENIRLKLLIAAQAVPRHQNEIYQSALHNVDEWIQAYFATNSSSVIDFVSELNQLMAVDITTNSSNESLKSPAVLDAFMKQKK